MFGFLRRWRKRARAETDIGAPDIEAFFDSLLRVQVGKDHYTAMDRYRDFRRVFGETEAGRRVLWQILDWTGLYRTSAHPDPHVMYAREGERNLGLRLIETMNAEPVTPHPKPGDDDGGRS